MQHKEINKKLVVYVDYLNHLYGNSPGKKLFYWFLYYLIIPLVKTLAWLLKPLVGYISKENTDILIVGECKENYTATQHVWDLLSKKNIKLKFVYNEKKITYFKFAFLSGISPCVPSKLYLNASWAKYLVDKYRPKLVCVFKSFDSFPTLLRLQLNGNGKTIFIPHSIVPENERYSSFDFDYYLVFGQSSLQNILRNNLRIGSTKAIITGPYTLQSNYQLDAPGPLKNVLYFSNWMVGKHPDFTDDFLMVIDWAKMHPDYKLFIKLHPLENNGFVINFCRDFKNVEVLPQTVTIRDALEKVSFAILSYSAAAMEAALLKRPVIVANKLEFDSQSPDLRKSDNFLFLEKYFPKRARTAGQIQERMNEITGNYAHYIDQCSKFTAFHCSNITDPWQETADVIYNIYLGKENHNYTDITETLERFKNA